MSDVLCSSCKRLRSDLEQSLKKVAALTHIDKENRLKPSSHFPGKYLSPKSLKKKKQNVTQERMNNMRLLKKYDSVNVTLNEDQHNEMCTVVDQTNKVGSKNLDDLFVEGDKEGVGQAIRSIWKNDVRNIKREFEDDQKQNGE